MAEIRRDAAEAQGVDATLIREQPPAEKNDVVTQDDDCKRTVSSALSSIDWQITEFERRMTSNEIKYEELLTNLCSR